MLRVGLIGCGFMGLMHANCYKIIDGVELVFFMRNVNTKDVFDD